MIKQKYKYLHLRTYEITFDDEHYNNTPEKYRNGCRLYTFSIYNNKNERCLKLNDNGITQITYQENSALHICKPYKDLGFNTKKEEIL